MEFNFRAMDDRPHPPSPIFNTFSETPLSPLMTVNSFPSKSNTTAGFSVRGSDDHELIRSPMLNTINARGLIMRDHEREMIREDIILCEIARWREIEIEARREIAFLERELAARRDRLSFVDHRFSRAEGISRPHCPPGHAFDNELAPIPRSSYPRSTPPHSFSGGCYGLSCRPDASSLPVPLTLPRQDVAGQANPNPGPNVSESKSKAVEEPPPELAASAALPFGLKKKPDDEWSCAICQVSVLSEAVLNAHLQGKKHTAKEERLRKQKLDNNPNNNAAILIKKKGGVSNPKLQAKLEGESLGENETGNGSKDSESATENDNIVGDLKNMAGSAVAMQANGVEENKKKQFTFWCEMCRVGSVAAQVMEDHKRGKKHRAKLQRQDKSK